VDPSDLPLLTDPTADAIRAAISAIAEAFHARDWPRFVGWLLAGLLAALNVGDVLSAARRTAWLYRASIVALGALEAFAIALVAGSAWAGAGAATLAGLLITLATPARRARIVHWYDSPANEALVDAAVRGSGWGQR
jgi:hypothetical protein